MSLSSSRLLLLLLLGHNACCHTRVPLPRHYGMVVEARDNPEGPPNITFREISRVVRASFVIDAFFNV